MSRRRRVEDQGRGSVQPMQVVVDLLCEKGHFVGIALKYLDPHPKAGEYRQGNGLHFEQSGESERVRGTCGECRADVVVRWDRVRALLDDNEVRGRHTDELRP